MTVDLVKSARRARAEKILGWTREVLRTNDRCGLGLTPGGFYVVIWPALIDAWIHQPETRGQFLGTLSRASTARDVEALLPPGEI